MGSREVYEDFKFWIDKAHNTKVKMIYPQEIASLALTGVEERGELRNALADSKLYNAKTRGFELSKSGRPQPLNIDLCFFDTHIQQKGLPYPGEFHYFASDDGLAVGESKSTNTRMTT